MAEDNRYRDRRPYGGDRDQGYDRGSDEGTIAQRGFGNSRSGYDDRDRGGFSREFEGDRERGGGGRERDSLPYRRDERSMGGGGGGGEGGRSYREERDVMGFEGSGYRSYGDRNEGRGGSFSRGDDDRGGFSRGTSSDRDVTGYRGERGFLDRAGDEISSWFGDDDASRRRQQDARQGDQGAGHHRGRGPKGYQRSDERIRDDVNDRLTDDPHIDASEIDVSISGREVTLTGTVSTRFEKRHAEDIVESVSGVSHVQNNLRVQQSGMGTNVASGGGVGIAGTPGVETGGGPSGGGSNAGTTSGGGLTASGVTPAMGETSGDVGGMSTGRTTGTTGTTGTAPARDTGRGGRSRSSGGGL